MVWILLGFGITLLGFGLLVSGVKGQWVSLWHVTKPLGIGIVIALMVFLVGKFIGSLSGMPWAFAGFGVLFLGYGVTVLYILFSPENTTGGAQLSKQYRAACMVLGFVLMLTFPVGTQYEKIATWLCKRAVQEGERSALAEIIDERVMPWNSLRVLAPSPQREQLVNMIAFRSPSKVFWETLLSLPPTPERLKVVTTFSRDALIGNDTWIFIVLYDQGDVAAQDMFMEVDFQLAAQKGSYYRGLLEHGVKSGRIDVVRYILSHKRAYFSEKALDAAKDANNQEMLTLLLDRRKVITEF